MKAVSIKSLCIILAITLGPTLPVSAGPVSPTHKPHRSRVELSWPTSFTNAALEVIYPEFEMEFSSDLKNWYSDGPKLRGFPGRSGPRMSYTWEFGWFSKFARIKVNSNVIARQAMGDGGAETFGYNDVL